MPEPELDMLEFEVSGSSSNILSCRRPSVAYWDVVDSDSACDAAG